MKMEKKKNYCCFRMDSRGLTIVEMLIAMFIFVLIMAGSVFLISQIYKRYGFAMEQGRSISQVQQNVKIMVDEIRRASIADSGAYPIQNADKFDFVFFADIDHDRVAERVHYYLQGITIQKGVSKPSGTPSTYPVGDQVVTQIGNYVRNTAGQPLFYYFDSNYPADQVNNPLTAPVSQINRIRMVEVDIYYNIDLQRAPNNIRLQTFVEMRNLKDNW
jgi:hypothetical protein